MANLAGFDASQVPEQQEFTAIPEGQYVVIATASEMKPNAKGTGEYLQFTFEVLDGQFKGRKLWSRLNLNNPNQTAVDIAQRELGAICRAVHVITPKESAELHNKPMLVTVAVELNEKKSETNTIKKYEAITGTSVAAPANIAAAQQQQAAAATTTGAAKAPWMK